MYPDKLSLLIKALRASDGILPVTELPEKLTSTELKKWTGEGVIKKTVILRKAWGQPSDGKEWFSQVTPSTAPRGKGGRMLKRDLLHQVIAQQGSIRQSSLRHFPEFRAGALRELEDEGLIANKSVRFPTLFSGPTPKRDTPPTLNPEQASAVETIGKVNSFEGFLLRGVTQWKDRGIPQIN